MGRRNDHSREEIRELALNAAANLVIDEGLAGLSARKVAGAIGYTVGSLYNVFANFDDLVLQLNGRSIALLTERARDAVSDDMSAQDQLRTLARTYVDFAFDNRNLWAAIFEHTIDEDEEWPAWYSELTIQTVAMIGGAVRKVRPDLPRADVEHAARTLFSGVHGACLLAIHRRLRLNTRDAVLDVADTLIDTWLQANNDDASTTKNR